MTEERKGILGNIGKGIGTGKGGIIGFGILGNGEKKGIFGFGLLPNLRK